MKIEDYKYKIELHAHTSPCSSCSSITPEEMIRYSKEAGLDAVVITNHFQPHWHCKNFNSKEELTEKYLRDFRKTEALGKEAGINVIFGMEIKFEENNNDYLVYGIDESFIGKASEYLDGTLARLYTDLKDNKNLIIHAHPFRNGMTRMPNEYLDGIETFNMHPGHEPRLTECCRYAKNNGILLTICGSDFHDYPNCALGTIRAKTLPKDSFELAEILKSRDFLFDIIGNIVVPFGFKEN